LDHAMEGVDWVIHAAAQISGFGNDTPDEAYERANQWGAINVLKAAERAGGIRMVMVSTGSILERTETVNEVSRIKPLDQDVPPYVRTKRAAYYESMARAARGQDVMLVFPGGIYGPSPVLKRALDTRSFNHVLLTALRGEAQEFPPLPVTWTFALDGARVCLAALERGRRGARYMAYGRVDDIRTTAAFCNRALEFAGLDHRVSDITDQTASGSVRFGTMAHNLVPKYPDPPADGSRTANELDVPPTTVDDGLRSTLDWFRAIGEWPR